ncbi:MAG: flagellar biosynthetic protein FliO [Deltaproteobacteria bacterium]|nr:flagellar biosynthetic protein FliO [Deltaproteobacteria bacterium]
MFDLVKNLIGGLIVVIPLIVVSLYFYSRHLKIGPRGVKKDLMKVVALLPMGPKKSIAVVDVAGEYLVLGVGADTITYLAKMDNPQIVEGIGVVSSATEFDIMKKVLDRGASFFRKVKKG